MKTHNKTHTLPIPSQLSGLAERQQQQWCGAVCCSLCTHLSPPAILASVIPLVHPNTDAELSPWFYSHLAHEDTSVDSITGMEGENTTTIKIRYEANMTAGEAVRWWCLTSFIFHRVTMLFFSFFHLAARFPVFVCFHLSSWICLGFLNYIYTCDLWTICLMLTETKRVYETRAYTHSTD